jgi:lipopolysaccharide biosynthesis glycosyltransferase
MIPLKIFVGFDNNAEPVAYHAFCQSVIEHSSVPVSFVPLALNTLQGYKETHTDGSNAFIYSRFLVPAMCNYEGVALFADGDMLVKNDIAELFALYDNTKAVQVVKHNYTTQHPIKYLGAKNENYPRKNWSSVILFNCEKNKALTPDLVMQSNGSYLHRFSWLNDEDIGSLPIEWNWLATEYNYNRKAKLVHTTLGTPCFTDYQDTDYSDDWWKTYNNMIHPLTGNGKASKL